MDQNAFRKAADLDFWSSSVNPQVLGGGLTNTNFLVEDRGERFVVRIGEDIPFHGIMRFNETASARAAYFAGISPEIVHHAKGVLVMRFIEGKTLTGKDIQNSCNLARVLALLKKCHEEIPQYLQGPVLAFWPFQVCRGYLITAREGGTRWMDALPRFFDINAGLEKTVGMIKMVFAHNDLLAANFIDDGQRLWLLDWDYAGYNAALFDLANLSSNNEIGSKKEEWLLENYFEKPVNDQLRLRFEAMKCASLLRETLWSVVQEIHSTLNFDYAKYSEDNRNRFEANYSQFQKMESSRV
ncbi:MAG: phosphotransferase [SAR324 cluster bacterium]|nr:phosphotransferase [SAR324 cluster bacterium]